MASHTSFLTSGFLLVIFTIISIQSAPIEKDKEKTVQVPSLKNEPVADHDIQKFIDLVKTTSSSTSITTNPTTIASQSPISTTTTTTAITPEKTDNNKRKRYINDDNDDDDDDSSNGLLDNESDELDSSELPYFKYDSNNDHVDHQLHASVKETSPIINEKTDISVDRDDSKLFTDSKMTTSEQTDIVRRRRDLKLNNELNTRRKRATALYDIYDNDALDEPYIGLIQRYRYTRPTRSFAPLYWYPSVYQRSIRSALTSSFYEPVKYPIVYANSIDTNDIEEDSLPRFDDENDDEDEDEYESNRNPIIVPVSGNLLDNLESEENYSGDDLQIYKALEEILNENKNENVNYVIDDDDDDVAEDYDNDDDDVDDDDNGNEAKNRFIYEKERPYYTRHGPTETYF